MHGRVEENGYITAEPKEIVYEYPVEASPLYLQLEHFIHCVRTRTNPRSSAENALAVAHVVDQL
jgi:hypothetical protein